MRVLVLGRLFSGLKAGLAEGRWAPRGVPAFYKLVEGLHGARDCAVLTLLAAKEDDPLFRRGTDLTLDKAGRVMVLRWERPTGGLVRRLDLLATEAAQLLRSVWQALRFGPDVIYATYAMLFPAALLARCTRIPVVLRLMGLFPHHRAIGSARFWLHRWALRSPFRAVVCSEDGSDPGALLPRLLNPASELVLRLNGCDAPAGDSVRETAAPPTVLFVGRLEPYKGCDHFVDAALACLASLRKPVRFVVVGDGPMRGALADKVDRAGASEAIVFTGAIPHAEVTRHLMSCDIYVSVNLNGNLSNANLEALAAGTCLVIPTSDPSVPIDTATDRLLPDDVVVRYDRRQPAEALGRALIELIKQPDHIAVRRAAAHRCARRLLKSWSECIEDDIGLLRRAVANGTGATKPLQICAKGRP